MARTSPVSTPTLSLPCLRSVRISLTSTLEAEEVGLHGISNLWMDWSLGKPWRTLENHNAISYWIRFMEKGWFTEKDHSSKRTEPKSGQNWHLKPVKQLTSGGKKPGFPATCPIIQAIDMYKIPGAFNNLSPRICPKTDGFHRCEQPFISEAAGSCFSNGKHVNPGVINR